MNGTVLDIMRLSTEDGPGVRTTVFLKGCTLCCAWCHNVESIDFQPLPLWSDRRCMGCLLCHAACKRRAVSKTAEGIRFDRALCAGCFDCADACPTGAIERKGRVYSAFSLADELMKDAAYFGGEGGVTLSGGEALAQATFACELLRELKRRGIHTAVDTCGMVRWEALEAALAYTDLVLYDLKIADSLQHKRWTGEDNGLILDNAKKMCAMMGGDTRLWVRTPVVPGATDSDENIKAIGAFIKAHMRPAEKWELLAFNNLCRSKYEQMGRQWEFASAQLIPERRMEELRSIASAAWGREAVWSGAARMKE